MPSSELLELPENKKGDDSESQTYHSAVETHDNEIDIKTDSKEACTKHTPEPKSKGQNIPKIKKAVDVIHSSEDESEPEPLEKIAKKKNIKQDSELTKEKESTLRAGYLHEEGSDYEADFE